MAEYDNQDIIEFQDPVRYGNRVQISNAASAFQQIIEGKKVQEYSNADQTFCETFESKIHDITDKKAISPNIFQNLLDYLQKHLSYSQTNIIKKAYNDAFNPANIGQNIAKERLS